VRNVDAEKSVWQRNCRWVCGGFGWFGCGMLADLIINLRSIIMHAMFLLIRAVVADYF
jgi:hypothetical protein